ncbi:MAG: DUF4147 domain-containing protein [Deltaproteobacteria bacterium]|nr:DUF4147 domain-containing protein [Deltaproteobacteria bacterium]
MSEASPQRSRARELADRIADEALDLARASVPDCVRDLLPRLPPPRARVRVAAVGKAAATMARVALDAWRGRIERALVVVPEGADVSGLEGADVLFAAHPLPDARSLAAGSALLDLARGLGPADVLLVLLSGGASALACAPVPGFSLDRERDLVERLLGSGLAIADVNCVRGHLSSIKRGGLAIAAYPARTLTLVVSDVLGGDDVSTVGGAPTVLAPNELSRFEALVRDVAPDEAEALVALASRRADHALSSEERAEAARRTRIVRAAGPELLVQCAEIAAEHAGRPGIVLPPMSRAVEHEAERIAKFLLHAKHEVVGLVHGEPTVTIAGPAGRGGRMGRLALLVARAIAERPDRAIAVRASDGVDGVGGLGGASCDATTWSALGAAGAAALDGYDDVTAHLAHGHVRPARPSGVNLLDLVVVVRS